MNSFKGYSPNTFLHPFNLFERYRTGIKIVQAIQYSIICNLNALLIWFITKWTGTTFKGMHGNSRDQWINKSFLRVAISLRNNLRCATSSRFVDTRRWISFKVSKVFEFLDTQGTRYSNLARSVYLFLPLTFYARCYKYYHVRICVYTLFQ